MHQGYSLELKAPSHSFVIKSFIASNPSNHKLVWNKICKLLDIGALEGVPPEKCFPGFYSIFFIVQKHNGGIRTQKSEQMDEENKVLDDGP